MIKRGDMAKCCNVMVFCSSMIFFTIGLVLVLAGYLVPVVQHHGYSLDTCTCTATRIDHPSNYHGIATLKHDEVVKDLTVIETDSYAAANTYLSVNFRINSEVSCYVSATDIVINLFISRTVLAFIIISVILGASLLILFFILLIKTKRRNNYIDLDKVVPV